MSPEIRWAVCERLSRGGDGRGWRAGIGKRRRPGVAYQRQALAFLKEIQQLACGGALVVLVQGHGAGVDAVAREQRARGARVLAGDDIGLAQRFERARAGVGQIADRRGDDEQDAGHCE